MTNVFAHRFNINARNIAKGVTHCLGGYQDVLSVREGEGEGERERERGREREGESESERERE